MFLVSQMAKLWFLDQNIVFLGSDSVEVMVLATLRVQVTLLGQSVGKSKFSG